LFTQLNQRFNTGDTCVVRSDNKRQAAVGAGFIEMHCSELITLMSELFKSHFWDQGGAQVTQHHLH
jgi:hypothetical protein